MMSTLLKLGLSGYDVKSCFCAFQCEYLLQYLLFLGGKNVGYTIQLCEESEQTLDCFRGGGVHGMSCWRIAYDGSTSWKANVLNI